MKQQKIKLIIVDDHQIFRDGIKSLFLADPCVEIIDEAASGQELVQKLNKQSADIVVLDLSLPDQSGFSIMEELIPLYPCIRFLILSANNDEESIIQSLKCGARGFLNKDTTKEEFKRALIVLHDGGEYFSESVSRIIFKRYSENVIRDNQKADNHSSLTNREREIIVHLCDGLSYKEIADRLCISIRTVETHRKNILEKLQIRSNAELVKYAIKEGLISLD
ncbi:MAG TPA: response regulator transcription factor [Prolixibacteraceae bacterium]|nr:response regulator transcription factor [Prolixibacteraceae bacterium]